MTAATEAARRAKGRPQTRHSREMKSLAQTLMDAPVPLRRATLRDLKPIDFAQLLCETEREMGTMYALWADTPSGFVEDVLGETIWSRQRQILDAIPRHKRIMVPAGFGVSKTFSAARSVVHFIATNPPGTALAVTTATRFRQVRFQLWPHIRKIVARSGLPGECDLTVWKIPDQYGNEVTASYGFTVPEHDSESALQGIHAAKLLLVVDEAGGISRAIGANTNNIMTGDARMLAIGNPPTDNPNSWFEELCEEGMSGEPTGTVTIRIPVTDSPAITGEQTPLCRDCPDGVRPHSLAIHLPAQDWVDRTIQEFGEDHPYVIAKVHARFPRSGADRAIPIAWIETSLAEDDPTDVGYVRLCDLDIPGETEKFTVKRGAWVRLGVDVAADGGDEFAICRAIGDVIHNRHASSGPENASAVDVAQRVLAEIHAAQLLSDKLGSPLAVRVKIDTIGVGWGVTTMLERWREMGRHKAVIVPVNVAERPEHDDESLVMRPANKRAEMWLAMRDLLQLDPATGRGRVRLRVDRKTAVQLAGPKIPPHRSGLTVLESKRSMKARGVSSPDRAEAMVLACYEPYPLLRPKRRGILV